MKNIITVNSGDTFMGGISRNCGITTNSIKRSGFSGIDTKRCVNY